jgi:hypothetical protein
MIPNIAPLEHIAPLHVEPLHVDAGSATGDDRPLAAATPDTQSLGFTTLLDSLGAGSAALGKAEAAENAFVAGTGGLQEMVFERAKADSIVSIAAAASSRVTQSLNTIAAMHL